MSPPAKNKFPRPRAKKIPFSSVKEFLQEKGYRVLDLHQQWRHVSGSLSRNGEKLFFKMATTIKTGKMTQNELIWNQVVGENIPTNSPFRVPREHESGLFQDKLFFYIGEFFEGETLSSKFPPQTRELSRWLPSIAKSAHTISSIKNWPPIKGEKYLLGKKLLESATEWASQLRSDTQLLLELIRESVEEIEKSFAHGDFVPWHMYDLGGDRLGLVDSEHGQWAPRYYDVAYFYLRVRQNLGEKDLATEFLSEFIKLLTTEEKSTFWHQFRPILAQRLIGNFWEVKQKHDVGYGVALQKCEEFKQDLIMEKII